MSELALRTQIDQARSALAEIDTVQESVNVAKFAESVRYAAKQAKAGMGIQNEAAEVRLRAERRTGELLDQNEDFGRGKKSATVSDFGINHGQSKRYQQVADVPEPVFEQYIRSKTEANEEIVTSRLLRLGREMKAEAQAATATGDVTEVGQARLVHCAVADLVVEPGSVALIITDPPYPGEFLGVWEDLAGFASVALKRGALLVSYTGQYHLPEVMYALSCELEYVWLGALVTPGAHNQVQQRWIRSAAKPLLFYSAGDYEPSAWFDDAFVSEERSKKDHRWQQSLGAAAYYIERLTKPGDLVVDPFLGSGTTAVAAVMAGREFVGCDIDAAALETARMRLADG